MRQRTWRVIEAGMARLQLQADTVICVGVGSILFAAGVIVGLIAGLTIGAWSR